MVIQVFIAQRQSIHPLPHQLRHPVFHQFRLAKIAKAISKLPDDPGPLLHLTQQQTPTITADASPIEFSSNFPPI
jgi:hypothetical protein